ELAAAGQYAHRDIVVLVLHEAAALRIDDTPAAIHIRLDPVMELLATDDTVAVRYETADHFRRDALCPQHGGIQIGELRAVAAPVQQCPQRAVVLFDVAGIGQVAAHPVVGRLCGCPRRVR